MRESNGVQPTIGNAGVSLRAGRQHSTFRFGRRLAVGDLVTAFSLRRRRAPWWSVAHWGLIGLAAGFGLAAAFTFGVYFLAVMVVLVALAFAVPRHLGPRPWPAALVGLSAAPGYVAWLNRDGPGEVCDTSQSGVTCIEQWNPWPIAAAALILAAVGVTLLVLLGADRRGSRWKSGHSR